jgi:hypothetical protein
MMKMDIMIMMDATTMVTITGIIMAIIIMVEVTVAMEAVSITMVEVTAEDMVVMDTNRN